MQSSQGQRQAHGGAVNAAVAAAAPAEELVAAQVKILALGLAHHPCLVAKATIAAVLPVDWKSVACLDVQHVTAGAVEAAAVAEKPPGGVGLNAVVGTGLSHPVAALAWPPPEG